jgi:hypothetical protein
VPNTREMVERAVEAMVTNHCRAHDIPPDKVLSYMAEACLNEEESLTFASLAVDYEYVENLSEFALEELMEIQDLNFGEAGRSEAAILRATEGAIRDVVEGIVMEDALRGISLN